MPVTAETNARPDNGWERMQMVRTILKILGATTLFAVVHSVLASRQAKMQAARLFGPRARNGGYRVFYLAQSVLSLALLLLYLKRLPDRVLYRVTGPLARLMNLGQLAAVLYAVFAAGQIGFAKVLGISSLGAWLTGQPEVLPEPEAQGPRLDDQGQMHATGPFAWSRHPLNFAPLPVFWLFPTMTLKLLVFNLAATVYFVLGSWHEETRLLAEYGASYSRYQAGPVPFYVPMPPAAGR